jgi:4-hydroxymandelate oxidase
MKPDAIISLSDFEELSQTCMSPMALNYVAGGAADELTLKANCEEWKRIRLKPRVLVDVSRVDISTTLMGQQMPTPILLAPTAFHRLCHDEGERATIAGANRAGASLVLSTYATEAVETIAAAAAQPLWFQMYAQSNRELNRALLERAEQAGCKAICLTVDTPVLGARNRESRSQFQIPADFKLPNLAFDSAAISQRIHHQDPLSPTLTWKDVEWLRSIATVPLILKGIINPDDAVRAAEAGIAGIIVSNHGGRNLDTLPSTAEALPRIAEKVRGMLTILVDGGIRRGTDVLKAIALGADAVLIGRPYLYGLAAAGAEGVARVLEILKTELKLALALTGRTSIRELDGSVLWD